jgi:ABC-type tungstate transport system substrate-binding protein
MNLQTIIPMPIYTGNGHSGPWTQVDTNICITISLVVLILTTISVIIDLLKGVTIKEILTIDPFEISIFTGIMMCAFYFFITIWFGVLLYNLIF